MRWKLVVGNLVAVVLVGLLAWSMVRGAAASALVVDVDPSVDRGGRLLKAVHTQDGDDLLNAVRDAAGSQPLTDVFSADSESAQREAAFAFAESFARQLGTALPRRGRPAELVAVLGADGSVMARNLERHQDAGRQLRNEFPAVATALQAPSGHPVRDYIRYGEQGWLEVAVVPVLSGATIRGGLLVGFALADSAARNDAQEIGVDVGFVVREGDHYVVQSLSVGQQREKEQLQSWANAPGRNFAGLLVGRELVTLSLGDELYHAAVLPMPGAHSQAQAGAIVLRSVTDAQAPATAVAMPVLWMMLVGLLLAIGYNLYVANYLERPIEQIEDGLLQVINGNQDFRINLEHAELGGIVYRVNQLVAALTGEEEEADEQGRISHAPPQAAPASATVEAPVIDEASMNTAADPAVVQALASEQENTYYERLRREYDDSRKSAGLAADRQSHEQFVTMVQGSEQTLAQKYNCTLVRFQVQARGRQVIFRPVAIR